jgi:hypothetical protein
MRIGTRLLVLVLGLAAPTTAISQDSSNGRDESPADIVATQVRDQGYRCDNPTSATQDRNETAPRLAGGPFAAMPSAGTT